MTVVSSQGYLGRAEINHAARLARFVTVVYTSRNFFRHGTSVRPVSCLSLQSLSVGSTFVTALRVSLSDYVKTTPIEAAGGSEYPFNTGKVERPRTPRAREKAAAPSIQLRRRNGRAFQNHNTKRIAAPRTKTLAPQDHEPVRKLDPPLKPGDRVSSGTTAEGAGVVYSQKSVKVHPKSISQSGVGV